MRYFTKAHCGIWYVRTEAKRKGFSFCTHARIVFETLPQGYPILYSVPLVVVPLPALR